MNTNSKEQMVTREGSRPASAEQRLKELGIKLPEPPEPFGTPVELEIIFEVAGYDRLPDAGTHRSATTGVDEDAAFDLAGP